MGNHFKHAQAHVQSKKIEDKRIEMLHFFILSKWHLTSQMMSQFKKIYRLLIQVCWGVRS